MTRAWLALLTLATGCGHTETYSAMLRPPEAPTARVELYLADQPLPSNPYYEVALVQAVGFGADAAPEDVAHALTQKAGALGCDAVVRVYLDVGYSRAHGAGVCVKYVGQAPVRSARPPLPSAPPPNPPPPRARPRPAPRPEALPSSGDRPR